MSDSYDRISSGLKAAGLILDAAQSDGLPHTVIVRVDRWDEIDMQLPGGEDDVRRWALWLGVPDKTIADTTYDTAKRTETRFTSVIGTAHGHRVRVYAAEYRRVGAEAVAQ